MEMEGEQSPSFSLWSVVMEKETSDNVQRDIGRLQAEVKSLGDILDEVRLDLKEVRRSFDELRGGTRFFMAASAAIGGIITLVIGWLSSKH